MQLENVDENVPMTYVWDNMAHDKRDSTVPELDGRQRIQWHSSLTNQLSAFSCKHELWTNTKRRTAPTTTGATVESVSSNVHATRRTLDSQ